jgi:hypothetical protein
LERLAMKDDGKFYGHSLYLTVILYILWSFKVILAYFFLFLNVAPRQIWQPWRSVASAA